MLILITSTTSTTMMQFIFPCLQHESKTGDIIYVVMICILKRVLLLKQVNLNIKKYTISLVNMVP